MGHLLLTPVVGAERRAYITVAPYPLPTTTHLITTIITPHLLSPTITMVRGISTTTMPWSMTR